MDHITIQVLVWGKGLRCVGLFICLFIYGQGAQEGVTEQNLDHMNLMAGERSFPITLEW